MIVRIERFIIDEKSDDFFWYPKVKLSDGKEYFINCLHKDCRTCEEYYRSVNNDQAKIVLTLRKQYVTLRTHRKAAIGEFISRFSKEVFLNQFSSDCSYSMKIGNIKFTEFSEVAELLRRSISSGTKSRVEFYIRDFMYEPF